MITLLKHLKFYWEKFPRNAICRRKDNQKQYLAILSVKGSKIGLETDEVVEVIDLRVPKDKISYILQCNNIYPAYHMNKKSWITIVLDNSINMTDIYEYIDESYLLAKK